MSKIRTLVVLLLALALSVSVAGASPGVDMFDFPQLSMPSYNANSLIGQQQTTGTSPIMAPSFSTIIRGSALSNHFHPVLTEPTWTSSMTTSPINQVLTLMHFKG